MEIIKNWLVVRTLFLLLMLHGGSVLCQDIYFTQSYATPLLLNPATVGTYTGTFRLSSTFRDQWRTTLGNPYQSFSLSGDVNYKLRYTKVKAPDLVGVGITFLGDRMDILDFNMNQILLTIGYHKILNPKIKQSLGIALQGGVMQKTVNYENLTFQDQFNAIDGFTLGTAENLPPNSLAAADWSLGLYYTVSPTKLFNYHLGMGVFHFNTPNISFYNLRDIINNELVKEDQLMPKYTFHAGMSYKTNDFFAIQPRANFVKQGPHAMLNLGTTFRYKVSKQSGQYLLFGPYTRISKGYSGTDWESITGLLGFEMNNFILGFSYDQKISHALKDRRSLNSFEFSIIYIGEHHNEDNFCPQF